MKKIKVLLFHGFMIHDRHDLRHLKAYMDENPLDNVEFELVNLYDRKVFSSSKNKNMKNTVKEIILKNQQDGFNIVLAGYSFSCGVASSLAKELNLSGVIYFAPSIQLLKTKLFPLHLKNAFKAVKLRIKHGKKKADKIMEKTKTRGIIPLSYHIVGAMLQNKKTFKNSIPYLAFRGNNDTFCLDEDLKFIARKSSALFRKSVTNFGEGWDHYFVYKEEFYKDYIVNEIKYFLERI